MGVDGMVKITNPDENVNHLPAVGKYSPDYSEGSSEPDESNNKRLFHIFKYFFVDNTACIETLFLVYLHNLLP